MTKSGPEHEKWLTAVSLSYEINFHKQVRSSVVMDRDMKIDTAIYKVASVNSDILSETIS